VASQTESDKSIQDRISHILGKYHARHKHFGALESTEEVEELEYLLARAENEMREAYARVVKLRIQLENRRGPLKRQA